MKQKQTTWDGKEVLIVEVPEGAVDVDPVDIYLYCGEDPFTFHTETFLGYRFAFASPLSPTEAEAEGWVEAIPWLSATLYTDYYKPQRDYRDIIEAAHNKAIPSLHSRIKAEGFDNTERVIVLIKN